MFLKHQAIEVFGFYEVGGFHGLFEYCTQLRWQHIGSKWKAMNASMVNSDVGISPLYEAPSETSRHQKEAWQSSVYCWLMQLSIWRLLQKTGLPSVRKVFAGLRNDGLLVLRAQDILWNERISRQFLEIQQRLVNVIPKSQSTSFTIKQGFDVINCLDFYRDPCSLKFYITKRLQKNGNSGITSLTRDGISENNIIKCKMSNLRRLRGKKLFGAWTKSLRKIVISEPRTGKIIFYTLSFISDSFLSVLRIVTIATL